MRPIRTEGSGRCAWSSPAARSPTPAVSDAFAVRLASLRPPVVGDRHDLQTWWKSYVQPRKDAQARRENIAKLTAFGVGVPEVDQKLTNPD
jgi:hypothetical protein